MMGIQNEREWASFCEIVLQQPDLATAARFAGNTLRVENRAELRALISEAFSELTRDEIANRLELAHIANAEMRTMQGFMEHPQLAARDRWREVDSPLGPLPALLPPATMSGVEAAMEPIPALGQHTEIILAEMGYERSHIEELRRTGVIS
jgi:itaconate CoA-transferase